MKEIKRDILFRGKRLDNGEWMFGQYTGLTDKNGTKIFEGDIVKRLFYLERPVLSVVTFKNGAFGLEWNRGEVKEFSAFTSICNCTYEVIGNVYDNAELLGDI